MVNQLIIFIIFSLLSIDGILILILTLIDVITLQLYNKFQYSLPLFIFLQMTVAMVFFVQFKWKWGVHTVSLQQSSTMLLF